MEEQKLKEKIHLLLFVPLSPKPLFCSIAPQTPTYPTILKMAFGLCVAKLIRG